ncbi:MAG: lysophospholipid acyltransferase family protein [Myxococcota bacterium]
MSDSNSLSRPLTVLISAMRYVVGFLGIALFSVPYILVVLMLMPWRKERIKMGNRYGKVIGPFIARVTGTRTVIHNAERLEGHKPAIYITNHSSELDPFIAMWLCPMGGCGIAKKSIGQVPFFGWAYRLSGHLLIDRSNREKAIASLSEVAEIVRQNNLSIWLWPEGTRSRDGRLLPFKKGFAHMAISTGLPIVPVVAHQAHHRWPARSLQMYPGRLDIDVLPSIDTSHWRVESLEEHIRQVRQVFIDALDPSQRPDNLPAAAPGK